MAATDSYIEVIIAGLLRENTDIPVYIEDDPVNHEAERIIVKNTGDTQNQHVNGATISFECYSTSTLSAKNLCETVKSLVEGFVSDYRISSVTFNLSYKDNDTTLKEYRYRATYQIVSNL